MQFYTALHVLLMVTAKSMSLKRLIANTSKPYQFFFVETSISQHSDIIPSLNSRLSMLSGLNGLTFHQHLLHRHLLAQQQQQQLQQTQQQETEKANPDLPIMVWCFSFPHLTGCQRHDWRYRLWVAGLS